MAAVIGRRKLLGAAGATAAAGIVGMAAYAEKSAHDASSGTTGAGSDSGVASSGAAGSNADSSASGTVAFYGTHQAGIVTPAQDRMHFAAFDVTTTSRDELIALLRSWTAAAASMTAGRGVEGDPTPYDAPPNDTGEADGLSPSRLTITFGFGPTLFRDAAGKDRFGLASKTPAALARLPHFPGDTLDPDRSDGDLCIQACADDPQVAVHAVRNLARIAFGTASLRWSQLGFGRTSSTSTSQATPRNLFGFKDGTANLKAEDTADLDQHLWVAAGDDPAGDWLAGGSFLVARRITMHLETWDRTSLREQETLIGRDRAAGAPLSGGTEFTEPDFTTGGRDAVPLIAATSHVAMAHPTRNKGVKMLRRGYTFADGSDGLGRLDAGLFFLAFVRNPTTQYIPMQTAMAKQDALVEYLQHRGSGLFAVPAGVAEGGYVGQRLFETV